MPVTLDRIKTTTTTTGTGTLTLGSAVTGHVVPPSWLDGLTIYYTVQEIDANGNPTGVFENGIGTYTHSGTTLSRDTILSNSSGTFSAISLASGTKHVGITALSALLNQIGPDHNFLINGSFNFIQRHVANNTAEGTLRTISSNDGYGPDRWRMCRANADFQCARIDTSGSWESGLATRYYGQFKKITNNGKVLICQPIESHFAPLQGKIVTFQIKMKSDASRTMRLGLLNLSSSGTIDSIPSNIVPSTWGGASTDPTFGTNLGKTTPLVVPPGANGTINGTAIDCSVTTSWKLFAGTFLVPATCKNIIPAVWSDDTLTGGTSILYLGEAGLYTGAAIRDWINRDECVERLLCARYYEQINSPGPTGAFLYFAGPNSGTHAYSILWGAPKRTDPTGTFRGTWNTTNVTSITLYVDRYGFSLAIVSSGAWSGWMNTVDDTIEGAAEL